MKRFERVAAPGAAALLRLNGRLHASAVIDCAALVLVVGESGARFAPLPPLVRAEPGAPFTVAYAVPAELLRGRPAFRLQLGDETLVDLDAPCERALAAAGAAAEARLQEMGAEIRSLHAQADARDIIVAQLCHERDAARARVAELEAERTQAEQEAAALRATAARAESCASRLDTTREELSDRVAALEQEVELVRAQGAQEAEHAAALMREAAARVADLRAAAVAAREEVDQRDARRVAAEQRAERLASERDAALSALDPSSFDPERFALEANLAAAWEYAVDVEARLGSEAALRAELEQRLEALLAHQEALALRVEELIAGRAAAESARDVLAARLGALAGD